MRPQPCLENLMSPIRLAPLLVLALVSPALAHTGAQPHVHGLAAGLWHPVSGLDHLLAMAAVGVWAGLVGGAARWAWPLSFLGAMALAAAASASGHAPPWTEAGVALSVAVLGVAVAWGVRAPVAVGAALCAALAVAHGQAHGAETPTDAAGLAFGLGFIVSTALLHAAGIGLAALMVRTAPLAGRAIGLGVAAAGAALLVG
jgi:urease accessory protein